MRVSGIAKAAAKAVFPNFRTRLMARRVFYYPLDTIDYAIGHRSRLTAPRGLWFVGGESDFHAINEEFLGYFQTLGGLKPDHRALDVGCGVGVLASRLTSFMSSKGSYLGFDIVEPGIKWCQKQITSRFPNFQFSYADLYHEQYNPRGRLKLLDWSFPARDGEFDFIWLKSVFTHMVPEHIRHYLAEIRRTLKVGGRCLVTIFLLDPQSVQLIRNGASSLDIRHPVGDYYVLNPHLPELAVGIPEAEMVSWCEKLGLNIVERRPGSWCGRTEFTSYQDILVLSAR
jgi:SAM-dependent methyltransferase